MIKAYAGSNRGNTSDRAMRRNVRNGLSPYGTPLPQA